MPEQKSELDTRLEEFNKELLVIQKKHEFEIGAQAFLTSEGKINAKLVAVDKTVIDSEKTEAIDHSSNV